MMRCNADCWTPCPSSPRRTVFEMWTNGAGHQPTCKTCEYPLLALWCKVMHNAGFSGIWLWPWQCFRKGVIRCYVLSTSNQYITIKNKFSWFFSCVLCMRISVIVFCLSSGARNFDFGLIINWKRNKWRPVRSDGRSDGDLSKGFIVYLTREACRCDPTYTVKVIALLVSRKEQLSKDANTVDTCLTLWPERASPQ
jgi:hypothetical protein